MGMLDQAKTSAPADPEQAPPETEEQSAEGADAPATEPTEADSAPSDDSDTGQGDPNVRMATPEEQKQYMAALEMLYKIMYVNEGSAMALVKHIDAKDKMGSIIKAVMVMVQQMNSKMKLLPPVLAQITQDAVDRMLEIAERIKKIQYSRQETLVLLAAAQDAVEKATGTVSGDDPTAPVAGDQQSGQAPTAAQPTQAPTTTAAPQPAPPGAQ